MSRVYTYVGSAELLEGLHLTTGHPVTSPADVLRWVHQTQESASGFVTATFVVSLEGVLQIADRHSEHVACAQGQPVLAAGEMTFEVDAPDVWVAELTNQSTGYCPEPACWAAVTAALQRAGVKHPSGWTHAFVFRRCEQCGERNLVKDDWFECAVCSSDLPAVWNFSNEAG